MSSVTSSTDQPASTDLLGDILDEAKIDLPDVDLSDRAEALANEVLSQPPVPAPKKRAYFWLKAPEGDEAFRADEMNAARKKNMEILKANGYEVVLFKTNREFLEHIKKDSSEIDLLVVSGHGSPYRIEDLAIRGDEITSTDPNLSEEEQQEVFSNLSTILKKDSIVFFDACLAGNKSVERNIAMVASKILPQSTVFASQHVTNFEPGFVLKEDEQNKDWGSVSEIYFGHYAEDNAPISTVEPTVYKGGVETTNQEAVPIPRELTARRSGLRKPYIIGAMVVAAVAAAVGIGSWWYSKSS